MISNKALATLFLITLNMQHATASSPDGTKEPSSSGESVLRVKKSGRPSNPRDLLVDTTSTAGPVEIQEESTEETSISQGQPISQVNKFGELIKQENYKKIIEIGEKMEPEEFMKQLCPVVVTVRQYKELEGYLRAHKMVALFYVYGDIRVVKAAIVASKVYDSYYYVIGGDLETAISLAFEKGRHDRVAELLEIRKGTTAEKDGQRKLEGRTTGFEFFVHHFLHDHPSLKDGIAFKRYFTS